jgi:hypothetical protein
MQAKDVMAGRPNVLRWLLILSAVLGMARAVLALG